MLHFPSPRRPLQASDLTEIWQRISRRHMSAGSGCGCGFGGLILQAADFELDIVEFVIDDARQTGRTAILPFIATVSGRGPDRYSLPALLGALGQEDDRLSPDDRTYALGRLETTLTSIEAAHNKGHFACD